MAEFCTIKRALAAYRADGADDGTDPDKVAVQGKVTLTPVLSTGAVTMYEDGALVTVPLQSMEARIQNGKVRYRGAEGIRVVAGGQGMNPKTIVYKATFSEMQAGGWSFKLPAIQFEAVPGGEVDLTLVAPAPNAPDGVVRGPAGTSISDVLVEGTDLVVMVTDESGTRELSRLPLDDVVRAEAQAAAQSVKDALAAELGDASESASKAKAEADRATEQATAAAGSADAAHDDAVATAADRVKTTADATATAADRVATGEDLAAAKSARSGAVSASGFASEWQSQAREQAGLAKTEADRAKTEANRAKSDADRAETAANHAADGVRSELSGLVSTASGHADSASGSAAAAAQSAADAASVVSDGVPDASTSMKGKVQLAGDLSGTADAPTVPGLAGKADTSHTHEIADVSGLQSALDGKVSTTSIGNRLHGTSSGGDQTLVQYANGATANTVAYRGTGATLPVGEPTDSSHATTKAYVDAVKTTADAALPASKIQVVAALPESPVEGTIYLVTGA